MVPEERNQVRCNVYGAFAEVERLVGDSADDRVWCFLDYGSLDVQISRNNKIVFIRLTTFMLLDLRLSLDCKLLIRIF